MNPITPNEILNHKESMTPSVATIICPSFSANYDNDDNGIETALEIALPALLGENNAGCQLLLSSNFDLESMQIGDFLGQGGFSCVHQVHIAKKAYNNDNDDNLRKITKTTSSTPSLYALKSIRSSLDPSLYSIALADIEQEGKILSQIKHKNIITLYATSETSLSNSNNQIFDSHKGQQQQQHIDFKSSLQHQDGYSLILELLSSETLSDRIHLTWKKNQRMLSRPQSQKVLNRIETVAMGTINGMKYLHDNGIVFRDLKPDNVGFDRLDGTVKLFDFGLAKHVSDCSPDEIAGSYRYMAPECMLGKCTKESLLAMDVYSFALLLWELITLCRPYEKYTTPETLKQKIATEHTRPSLSSIRSKGLQNLLSACWQPNASSRPSFATIQQRLSDCCKAERAKILEIERLQSPASPRMLKVIKRNSRLSTAGESPGRLSSSLSPVRKTLAKATRKLRKNTTKQNDGNLTDDDKDIISSRRGSLIMAPPLVSSASEGQKDTSKLYNHAMSLQSSHRLAKTESSFSSSSSSSLDEYYLFDELLGEK